MKSIYKAYERFAALASYLQSPFLLAVRLYWGWQLMQSGWGKLHHLDRVTDFFTSLNLPMPGFTATCVSGLEFFGGLLLILGLGSRLICGPGRVALDFLIGRFIDHQVPAAGPADAKHSLS